MLGLKRRKKHTTVKDLSKIDPAELSVLIKYAKPSNKFKGKELPDILNWKFCDVIDFVNDDVITCVNRVLKSYAGLNEDDCLVGKASEYISLLRHVKNEFEKVGKLMDQLKNEPSADMVNAGVDKMNRFGVMGIYYAIDKNPTKWDAISETPFGIMYSKLMMDKVSGEIQEEFGRIQADKAKSKSR